MAKVIKYAPHAAQRRARDGAAHTAMVSELTEALMALGGQAHRNAVIERVCLGRGLGLSAIGELRHMAIRAFETQMAADRQARPDRPLFALPFGEGSPRWALAPQAQAFIREQKAG
jgi:hypothetical protein